MPDNKTAKLFSGLSTQTIITIVMGVLEIVLFAIMSRLLTKSEFGYYAALTGIMAICMSVSEAGLGAAIIQKKDANNDFISTAFTLSLLLGGAATLIVYIMAPWLAVLIADETLVIPLQIMSVTILFHSLISVGNAIFFRNLNFKRVGLNSIISYTLSAFVGVILAYKGYGLIAVVSFTVLNVFVTTILTFLYGVKVPKILVKKKEVRGIVSFGGWLTMGVLLNNMSHQLDKLVLSKWLSVEALGAYNRPAGFITNISTKINGIFDTVLFPMLSDMQENREKIQTIFMRAVSLLNSFSVILAAVFFFNTELIITIFFGDDWLELVPIMQIVSLSVIFNIDGRLVDCFFRSLGLVKLGFVLRFIAMFVTLLCLYIGAQHGIIGVAWGLFIANVSVIVLKMVVLCKKIRSNVWLMFKCWVMAWKSVVIPAILGGMYLLFLPHNFVVNVVFAFVFSLVVFVEFFFFPGVIGKEYEETLYPILQKIREKFFL